MLAFFLFLFVNCSGENDLPDGVVAMVDDTAITAADLSARFAEGPREVRSKAMQKGGRHYLLDKTIEDALLFNEARRQNINPSFSYLFPRHQHLMKQFLEAEYNHTVSESDITEEEIRAEYARRVSEYRNNEVTLEIKVIYRSRVEEAETMISRCQAAFEKGGTQALKDFYRQYGHRRPGEPVDLAFGPLARGQTASYLGADVEQAAWALDFPDEAVFPQPVPHQGGYGAVVVLERFEAPPPPSYEEDQPHVRRILYEKLRDRRLTPWANAFRKHIRVTINEENMDLVPWYPEHEPVYIDPTRPRWQGDAAPPAGDAGPATGDGDTPDAS